MLVHKKSTEVLVMRPTCMALTPHRNCCRSDDNRTKSWWLRVTELSRQSPFGAASFARLHVTPDMPLHDEVGVAEEAVGEEEGSFCQCEIDDS